MADHHNHHHHHLLNKRPSWVCTVAAQAVLCLALYAVLSIGRPQNLKGKNSGSGIKRDPRDLFFLSVRGGFWPPRQQTQLLQQMTKAAKIYNATFVVNISDLGEDDPLTQNATLHFPFLKIPWYPTPAAHGDVSKNFVKSIKIPYGRGLDIIGLDTESLQLNETESDQLSWLRRTLASSNSSWHIVVGSDSLTSCEGNEKKSVKFFEPLRECFIEYGVNAYLSQQSCAGPYHLDEGLAFIGNPGPSDQNHRSPSIIGYPEVTSEMANGFVLHKVSRLEIESYFFKSTGNVVFKSTIHQQRRGVV